MIFAVPFPGAGFVLDEGLGFASLPAVLIMLSSGFSVLSMIMLFERFTGEGRPQGRSHALGKCATLRREGCRSRFPFAS